jgi:rhodanese-related sulfurtransferase
MMNRFTNLLFGTVICVGGTLGFIVPASADEPPETPTTLSGGKVISVAEAKKLTDAKAATFVDTRSVVNFGKGHVPGAMTASYKEKSDKVASFDPKVDSFELDKLPKNKSAAVVFYSDGPTGWKSYKAAVLSISAGYTNVQYMRGGYAEWTAKGFPVEH